MRKILVYYKRVGGDLGYFLPFSGDQVGDSTKMIDYHLRQDTFLHMINLGFSEDKYLLKIRPLMVKELQKKKF